MASNNNTAEEVGEVVLGIVVLGGTIAAGLGIAAIAGPLAALPFVGGALSYMAKEGGTHVVKHSPHIAHSVKEGLK